MTHSNKGAPQGKNAVLTWVSSKTGLTPPQPREFRNFWGTFGAFFKQKKFRNLPPPLMEETQVKSEFFC